MHAWRQQNPREHSALIQHGAYGNAELAEPLKLIQTRSTRKGLLRLCNAVYINACYPALALSNLLGT